MSGLANSIFKFLRGDPRKPHAMPRLFGALSNSKPSVGDLDQVPHTSTPANSLESPPATENTPEICPVSSNPSAKQDPDIPHIRAEADCLTVSPTLHADLDQSFLAASIDWDMDGLCDNSPTDWDLSTSFDDGCIDWDLDMWFNDNPIDWNFTLDTSFDDSHIDWDVDIAYDESPIDWDSDILFDDSLIDHKLDVSFYESPIDWEMDTSSYEVEEIPYASQLTKEMREQPMATDQDSKVLLSDVPTGEQSFGSLTQISNECTYLSDTHSSVIVKRFMKFPVEFEVTNEKSLPDTVGMAKKLRELQGPLVRCKNNAPTLGTFNSSPILQEPKVPPDKVFQSLFRDFFRSSICYEALHKAFSEGGTVSFSSISVVSLSLASCRVLSGEILHNLHLFDPQLNCLDITEVKGGCPDFSPCDKNTAIPHFKLRDSSDQDNFSGTTNFGCPDGSDGQKLNSKEVGADLPFIIDSFEAVSNSYCQALRFYLGQCHKHDHIKGVRKDHQDLVTQGLIQNSFNLPSNIQRVIHDALCCQYFPFFSVCKVNVLSTPGRLIVDPSMTGLGRCLSSSENKTENFLNISMDGRSHPLLWSNHVGNRYNCIKVEPSSLVYQLLLLDNSLVPSISTLVWVSILAENQASTALEALISLVKAGFPNAVALMIRPLCVECVTSGENAEKDRDTKVNDTQNIFNKGAFPFMDGLKVSCSSDCLSHRGTRCSPHTSQWFYWYVNHTAYCRVLLIFYQYFNHIMYDKVFLAQIKLYLSSGPALKCGPYTVHEDEFSLLFHHDIFLKPLQTIGLSLTTLLRDFFLYLDVVLYSLRSDTHCFMVGFSECMCDALQDTEVIPTHLDQTRSRQELLFFLCYSLWNGLLVSSPPSRVVILSEILGPWPSIVVGGPRLLHQVRHHFLPQCNILKAAAVPNRERMMPYPITVRMRTAAAHGIPRLSGLDYSIPVDMSKLGLTVHPKLAHLVLGNNLSSSIARPYKRVCREIVYEWCRLNLNDIQRFLDCMIQDKHWSEFKCSFLYKAQMIFYRCLAQTPPDPPEVSKALTTHTHFLWIEEERVMEKIKENFERLYKERRLNHPAPNPPKKYKVSPQPTDSKGVGFVWDGEVDCDLELETSVCDEDLLVGC